MIEATSEDKKIFNDVGDAIIRREPFSILVKGKKARIFKRAYELEHSKTKNFLVTLKCFFLQARIANIWSCLTMAGVAHTVKISDLGNGDVLISGIPKDGSEKPNKGN